ncbi:MAG: DUF3160 domain-containing protein [Candidatus Marinimicrobia bacterium]|nr:DUF3160 domain-containing protein [Candidatus Neomarinimicrobiota bacterium]
MQKIVIPFISTILFFSPLPAQMLADITGDVDTEFGTYQPYLVSITPSLTPYTVAPDFSNVSNYNDFNFTAADDSLLLRNAFMIRFQPNSQYGTGYRQIYDIYFECRDQATPIFVTTDAVLHTFHVLYDYTLRIMEMEQFIPDLDNLATALVSKTQEHYSAITDSTLGQAALKNLAYSSVAAVLLDSSFAVPAVVQGLVQAEIDLIAAHAGQDLSPIFNYAEDYSQYVPRGHYTRNEDFMRYFRAMMWYGRITFFLDNDFLNEAVLKEHTRQALLLVHALQNITIAGEPLMTVWERIYAPTVFFVGKADDLTILDYIGVMEQVYGSDCWQQSVDIFADETALDQFRTLADALPWPEINAWAGKGFRLMGQRYIPDSYMLGRLVYPYIPGRWMPKGLDIMTILGSQRAWQILGDFYDETANPFYVTAMDSLQFQFAGLPNDTWAQNLYWNWLYSLMPLLFPKGVGYPTFMQNQAWSDKELFTALASWGELRHDTILYAKQSTGTTGHHPSAQFVAGYVEPNPYLYARLAALTDFIATGLATRDLYFAEFDWRYTDLSDLLLNLKTISEKELTGQPLTTDEQLVIVNIGSALENLVTFPDSLGIEADVDEAMAVIADVHTNLDMALVLEEGVGYPLNIYVIVEIGGELVVTRGGIFSYYEFAWPADDRLTDEAWQTMQTGNDPQTLPVWTVSFTDSNQNLLNSDPQFYFPTCEPCVSVTGGLKLPEAYLLHQNYPNPFNPRTHLRYELPEQAEVTVSIYDLQGREINVLVNALQGPGIKTVTWNGRNESGRLVSSGLYIYRLQTGDRVFTRKLLLLR